MKKIKRVVLDSTLKMPLASKLMGSLSKGDIDIYTTEKGIKGSKRNLELAKANVVVVGEVEGRCKMSEVIEDLGKRGVTSVLIEGGSRILSSAFEANVVDKVYFFMTPSIIHGKNATSAIQGLVHKRLKDSIVLDRLSVLRIGRDMMVQAYPTYGTA